MVDPNRKSRRNPSQKIALHHLVESVLLIGCSSLEHSRVGPLAAAGLSVNKTH